MPIDSLLPIIGGYVGEKVYSKLKDKVDDLKIKEKANVYLTKKYQSSSVYKNYKELQTKRNLKKLESNLSKEFSKLKNSENKDIDTITESLDKISDIESEIQILKNLEIKKKEKEDKIREAAIKKLESFTSKNIDVPDTLGNTDSTLNDYKNLLIENNKVKQEELKNVSNKIQEQPKALNVEKKKRNVKNKLGRLINSKNKQKPNIDNISTAEVNPSFITSGNFIQPSLLDEPAETSNETTIEKTGIFGIKNLKVSNKLLLNSEKQLETLENIDENIKKLPGAIDGNSSGGLTDLLKSGGLKKKAMGALAAGTKFAGKASLIGAGLTVASGVNDYYQRNKELEQQHKEGLISDEDYKNEKKKNKYTKGGKVGGALAGAAAGAALGSFVPIVGNLLGAGIGGIIGGMTGEKGGESLNEHLATTAYLESGFNPEAKASTSSATGMYQFTDGTWLDQVKKHGKDYTLEDRKDPKKAMEMAALLTQENKNKIEKSTGKQASGTDLYMGHFLGGGGAASFLKEMQQNPEAKADEKFKKQASANQSIFYNKDGTPKSYKDIYNLMDNKYKKASETSSKLLAQYTPETIASIEPSNIPNENNSIPTFNNKQVSSIDQSIAKYDSNQKEKGFDRIEYARASLNNDESAKQQIVNHYYNSSSKGSTERSSAIDDYISSAIKYTVNL